MFRRRQPSTSLSAPDVVLPTTTSSSLERTASYPQQQPQGEEVDDDDDDDDVTTTTGSRMTSTRELMAIQQRGIVVWLGMMYCIIMVCRVGFGWTPGRQTPLLSMEMVSIAPQNVTIVTAYFDVPSKRPSQEYMPWIQHFLSLKDNMIIFTSNDQVPLFTKLRKKRPNTKIIGLNSLEETQIVKDFGGMDFWIRQAMQDPEKYIHSKELYVIWNEKGHFLQQAMTLNPFHSDFFAWVDMGYLRHGLFENQYLIRYLPAVLTRQQAIFLDVRPLLGNGEQYLGGGFIGGYREGLEKWTTEYYTVLQANRDRFLGKDQPWMFETCVLHPGLCLWVEPRDTYGDPWFHMAPLLHGLSKYGTMDHLRRVWRSSRIYKLIRWATRERLDPSMLIGTE